MFKNIGEKIKKIAKILFWVELIIFVLVSFVYAGQAFQESSNFIVFIIVFIVGIAISFLIAYVSVVVTYGFGELISLTKKNNELLNEIKNAPKENKLDNN